MMRFVAVAFTASAASSGVAVASSSSAAPTWRGRTPRDLHREYSNIFKHGNRNAASHLWSAFLLQHAHGMTRETFETLSTGYCAVSGSPVTPNDYNRYLLRLDHADGSGPVAGFMHYCCWPCVCDTQDFIRVDTRNVTTVEGTRSYNFAVIGNPCEHPEKLREPFGQFGRTETLARAAQEVRCDGGTLVNAPLSDHGHIIISLFFDLPEGHSNPPISKGQPGRVETVGGVTYQDEGEYERMCTDRANANYNSGMGEIFRRVAQITPLDFSGRCEAEGSAKCAAPPALNAA